MTDLKNTEAHCNFETERLRIKSWNYDIEDVQNIGEKVIEILSPEVTKALPDGWQNINSVAKATNWLMERTKESEVVNIYLSSTNELIGFIFLYKSNSNELGFNIRFGYLLSENVWGKGLGTELIKGLVTLCKKNKNIISLSGGVEKDNIGSIKVMEKNGFSPTELKTPTDNVIFYEIVFKR